MKLSLALGARRPLSPQTAWGCLTSNLALPGSGSLMAGCISGYAQLALAFGGMVLSLATIVRLGLWYFANYSRFQDFQTDQVALWREFWLVLRWPLLGMFIFAAGWLWGLASGLLIVQVAKKTNLPPKLPPRLP